MKQFSVYVIFIVLLMDGFQLGRALQCVGTDNLLEAYATACRTNSNLANFNHTQSCLRVARESSSDNCTADTQCAEVNIRLVDGVFSDTSSKIWSFSTCFSNDVKEIEICAGDLPSTTPAPTTAAQAVTTSAADQPTTVAAAPTTQSPTTAAPTMGPTTTTTIAPTTTDDNTTTTTIASNTTDANTITTTIATTTTDASTTTTTIATTTTDASTTTTTIALTTTDATATATTITSNPTDANATTTTIAPTTTDASTTTTTIAPTTTDAPTTNAAGPTTTSTTGPTANATASAQAPTTTTESLPSFTGCARGQVSFTSCNDSGKTVQLTVTQENGEIINVTAVADVVGCCTTENCRPEDPSGIAKIQCNYDDGSGNTGLVDCTDSCWSYMVVSGDSVQTLYRGCLANVPLTASGSSYADSASCTPQFQSGACTGSSTAGGEECIKCCSNDDCNGVLQRANFLDEDGGGAGNMMQAALTTLMISLLANLFLTYY